MVKKSIGWLEERLEHIYFLLPQENRLILDAIISQEPLRLRWKISLL